MTHEFLLELINKRSFLELALILVAFFISWLIVLQLGFHLLKVEVGIKKIIPVSLCGAIINLFLKPFLPVLLVAVLQVGQIGLYLKIYAKNIKVLRVIWTTFLILVIVNFAVNLIEGPISLYNKDFFFFMTKTWYGMIVGSSFEISFPLIAILLLRTFGFSVIPPLGKTRIDIIGVFSFGALIFAAYQSHMNLFFSLMANNTPKETLNYLISTGVLLTASLTGNFVHYTGLKKYHESLESKSKTLEVEKDQIEQQREIESKNHEVEKRTLETEKEQIAQEKDFLENEKDEILQQNEFLATERDKLIVQVNNLEDLNQQLIGKNVSPEEMDFILKNTLHGIQGMRKSLKKVIKYEFVLSKVNQKKVKLTPRELSVLELVAEGKENDEIAALLSLKPKYIKTLISEVHKKLEVNSRPHLIAYVRENIFVGDK